MGRIPLKGFPSESQRISFSSYQEYFHGHLIITISWPILALSPISTHLNSRGLSTRESYQPHQPAHFFHHTCASPKFPSPANLHNFTTPTLNTHTPIFSQWWIYFKQNKNCSPWVGFHTKNVQITQKQVTYCLEWILVVCPACILTFLQKFSQSAWRTRWSFRVPQLPSEDSGAHNRINARNLRVDI